MKRGSLAWSGLLACGAVLSGAVFSGAVASCALDRPEGLGASCTDDEDCPRDYFCGADVEEEGEAARICVPEADCAPDVFGVECAGPGFYHCVDNAVRWAECPSGECVDDECVPE
jgi:hypothetical protein